MFWLFMRAATSATWGITIKVPLTLDTSGPPGALTTTSSGNVPRTIPDGSPTGVTSTHLLPASAGAIADMNVRITKVTHAYVSDLVISIKTPWGATATLFNQRGGGGANLQNTVFDDEAAKHIAEGEAPFTGAFRPEQPMTSFKGRDASGTWALRLVDLVEADQGTLNGWGLNRRDMVCAP